MDTCLNNNDQQYFGELFTNLTDAESKLSLNKAMNFFNTCQLSSDNLEKIIDLCGAKRLGHFGRSQFYIALKLIACAQSGYNISLETLSNANHVPLPLFGLTVTHEKSGINEKFIDNNVINYTQFNQASSQLPPPPSRIRHDSGPHKTSTFSSHLNFSSDLKIKSNSFDSDLDSRSFLAEMNNSPQFCETRCKSWEEFTRDDHLEGGLIDWDKFEEGKHLLGNEDDAEKSDKGQSSDEETKTEDFWEIRQDQKENYFKQFKSLQTNLNGKISGSIARHFFEKSNLPSHELSKIWRLSDADKDGALNYEEFCTAMHLVILRRNNIEFPEFSPFNLDPKKKVVESSNSSPKNFLHFDPPKDPFKLGQSQNIPTSSRLSSQSKQWTKFTDSPTNDLSNFNFSPPLTLLVGMDQPANFDFNSASIEKDPKILHPVALRLSPDGQVALYDSGDNQSTFQNCFPDSSQTTSESTPICFTCSSSSHLSSQKHLSCSTTKKDFHLIPPPRPVRKHVRNSSLDLSCIERSLPKMSTNQNRKIVSHSSSFFPNNSLGSTSLNPGVERKGAFTVYKKDDYINKESYKTNIWLEILKAKYPLPKEIHVPRNVNDYMELGETVKALQKRNILLEKIIEEILQEFATVMKAKV